MKQHACFHPQLFQVHINDAFITSLVMKEIPLHGLKAKEVRIIMNNLDCYNHPITVMFGF